MAHPYDKIFKALAESDPRGLLYLFGVLPLDVPATVEVKTLPRDLTFPARHVDHVYHVKTPEMEWIEHFECVTKPKPDLWDRIVWYAILLAFRYRLHVETTVVLLTRRYRISAPPSPHVLDFGPLKISFHFRVRKIWELDVVAK